MAIQALNPGLYNLPVFRTGSMADFTVQYPGNVLLVRKGEVVDLDLSCFKALVAFAALRMRGLKRLGQRDGALGMADLAGGLFPPVTFEAGLFCGSKGGRIVGIVVDIVVTGRACVLQFLNMEAVRNRDIIGIDLRGSTLHIKNTRMATNTVRIDLVQFGGKPSMFPFTFKRKDIDARHQGMAGRMTF